MAYFIMPQRRRCFTAILDSGERREFESGAVRDIQTGKGRCDLLPLDICGDFLDCYSAYHDLFDYNGSPLLAISRFLESHDFTELYCALYGFSVHNSWDVPQMLLEVSRHFEEGANKYGERNWEKGIPAHCYIDSAVRHYLKWYDDMIDERHDRAFCWNLLCLAWTLKHRPECNDLWGDEHGNG